MGPLLPRVGVRDLRQNLSVYLRRVAAGETLEVTEHGHPVARLTPLPRGASALDRLEAEGRLVQRAAGDLLDLGPALPNPTGVSISKILEELREDVL
jgi:prevent-host-death family protein